MTADGGRSDCFLRERLNAQLPIRAHGLRIRRLTRPDLDRLAAWPEFPFPYGVFAFSFRAMNAGELDELFCSRDADPARLSLVVDRSDESCIAYVALLEILETTHMHILEASVALEESNTAGEADPALALREQAIDNLAAARQVLVIYCPGAVSHVDTFDHKPALTKLHGQKPPGIPAVTFEGPSGKIAKPFWKFEPRGESGKMVSGLLPHLARQVDDFCFFHALTADTSAHPQGENFMNTGFTVEGFPSFGSWVTYALGTESRELPAFVAINDPRGLARRGRGA